MRRSAWLIVAALVLWPSAAVADTSPGLVFDVATPPPGAPCVTPPFTVTVRNLINPANVYENFNTDSVAWYIDRGPTTAPFAILPIVFFVGTVVVAAATPGAHTITGEIDFKSPDGIAPPDPPLVISWTVTVCSPPPPSPAPAPPPAAPPPVAVAAPPTVRVPATGVQAPPGAALAPTASVVVPPATSSAAPPASGRSSAPGRSGPASSSVPPGSSTTAAGTPSAAVTLRPGPPASLASGIGRKHHGGGSPAGAIIGLVAVVVVGLAGFQAWRWKRKLKETG